MTNKILIAILMIVGLNAQAQTAGPRLAKLVPAQKESEYFFQADEGKHALTPRISFRSISTHYNGDTSDTKTSGLFGTGVSYEYGLSELLSVGGALYFSSMEMEKGALKTKASGLQDPELTLKGTTDQGWGQLHFGAKLGLAIEKAKSMSASRDGNVSSGGISLTPYVGADLRAGEGLMGARLSYGYKMERTWDVGGTNDLKATGGNEIGLSAFYEHFFADMLIGGALNYLSVDTLTLNGAANPGSTTTGISLYSRTPLATFELIPRFDYDFIRNGDRTTKWNDMTFSVVARFGF